MGAMVYQTRQQVVSLLLYCVTLLIISLSFVHHLIYHLFIFHFFTLKITHFWKITYIDPSKIHIFQITSKISRPPPKHFSKLVNNNTTLNLNIASYFLNILASPYVLTWFTTVGPITKTIKNIGLNKHHLNTVERTWKMVNRCKEMELQYIGKILQSTLLNLTFKKIRMNSIFLQMRWKIILACATQPISSIIISTKKVLMQCVSPLLI